MGRLSSTPLAEIQNCPPPLNAELWVKVDCFPPNLDLFLAHDIFSPSLGRLHAKQLASCCTWSGLSFTGLMFLHQQPHDSPREKELSLKASVLHC